ncbi:hypothetical protein [Streptomyces sp. NPDC057623]|uniref:hypothetical protein n=1 Tax=Streptomyces sp. NPDC057623 TaxID=3346187 RepID=UPI0036BB9A28
MDISGTHLRAVRAALFTALVVSLSTASHVLLSRAPLPLNTVASLSATVCVLAYALCGRERSFGRIAALLIPLELTADTILTTGQHVCYGTAGGPITGPLRSVGFDVLCGENTAVGIPLAGVMGTDPHHLATFLPHADPRTPWLLLGAHIGVGLLAAAWLRRGERALAQLARAVAATTFRPLLLAVEVVTVCRTMSERRLPRHTRATATARDRMLVHSLGRRGPPCSVSTYS